MKTEPLLLSEIDLDLLITITESFTDSLEILETTFKNPRTVTQSKYPNVYKLLGRLKDTRVTLRANQEKETH